MAFSLVSIISLLSTSEKKSTNKMIESVILKTYLCNKIDWSFGNIPNRGCIFVQEYVPYAYRGHFVLYGTISFLTSPTTLNSSMQWHSSAMQWPDIPIDFEQLNIAMLHSSAGATAHGLISPLSQAGTMRAPRVTATRQNGPTSCARSTTSPPPAL